MKIQRWTSLSYYIAQFLNLWKLIKKIKFSVKNGDRNVHLKYNINQGALQGKRAIDNAVYTFTIVNIFARSKIASFM